MSDSASELLALNQRLLDSIVNGDWITYANLCDPSLTCFEPEAKGQLVAGMAFHQFFFNLGAGVGPRTVTMASPHVRIIGDAAILSYVRLNQKTDNSGSPVISAVEETRVWERRGGKWLHVHFHRSPL